MLDNFAQVGVFFILSTIFVLGALVSGFFVRPRNPNPVKMETYECGEKAVGPAWINFNIRFYLIALIFVIFDVEAALLFPVASVFKSWVSNGKGGIAFLEIMIFVLILAIALFYAWSKGDLKWVKNGDSSLVARDPKRQKQLDFSK